MSDGSQKRVSPYVGPREFHYGEPLYGRDHETRRLLDLLIAERIVLVYSPSGAGKSSLIRAALTPKLEEESFTVLPVARVNTLPGAGVTRLNRYTFSLLLSFEEAGEEEKQLPEEDLARLDVADYLGRRWGQAEPALYPVLIVDQFEEILTSDPTDLVTKKEFFVQVGKALENRNWRALFAMREEYLAGLDPYLQFIPTRFSTRFRLELLKAEDARKAIQKPAENAGVRFTDPAARKLVDDLRRVHIQALTGKPEEQLGPYIEPVQLQVVCQRLWNAIPAGSSEIGEDAIEDLGDVDSALAAYYGERVKAAAAITGVPERFIRDWIENQLIIGEFRGQVQKGADLTFELDNKVVEELANAYLIRAEQRRGLTWIELAHDRLIAPVRKDNASWRVEHLESFQSQAALWDRAGRPSRLELSGRSLKEAMSWAAKHPDEVSSKEREFLNVSHKSDSNRRRTHAAIAMAIIAILLIPLAVIYAHNFEGQPWGELTDPVNGRSYLLRTDAVSIGRSTPEFISDIPAESQYVSRFHLVMNRNRKVTDVRSMNGTTINANYLPYGKEQATQDGDIMILAGVQLYRFTKIDRSYFFFLRSWFPIFQSPHPEAPAVSPRTWGLLIDGSAKRLVSLTAERYWLEESNGELKVGPTRTDTAILEIRHPVPGKPTIIYRGKPNVLLVWTKKDEYQYESHPLKPSVEYRINDSFPASWPFIYRSCTSMECTDLRFQIIPLLSETDNSGKPAD
jgi:Novel STAND NTPase 1/FHA domain